jgi:hypothetical protein
MNNSFEVQKKTHLNSSCVFTHVPEHVLNARLYESRIFCILNNHIFLWNIQEDLSLGGGNIHRKCLLI